MKKVSVDGECKDYSYKGYTIMLLAQKSTYTRFYIVFAPDNDKILSREDNVTTLKDVKAFINQVEFDNHKEL